MCKSSWGHVPEGIGWYGGYGSWHPGRGWSSRASPGTSPYGLSMDGFLIPKLSPFLRGNSWKCRCHLWWTRFGYRTFGVHGPAMTSRRTAWSCWRRNDKLERRWDLTGTMGPLGFEGDACFFQEITMGKVIVCISWPKGQIQANVNEEVLNALDLLMFWGQLIEFI